jgi:hypothetical protein
VKPSVHYFRVFGCIAHVHIPDVHKKKLDDKSTKCVLLGVSDESKAYKLYNHADKKIVVSRDVVFEEDKCWDWDSKELPRKVETTASLEENEEIEIDHQNEHDDQPDEHDEQDGPIPQPMLFKIPNLAGKSYQQRRYRQMTPSPQR